MVKQAGAQQKFGKSAGDLYSKRSATGLLGGVPKKMRQKEPSNIGMNFLNPTYNTQTVKDAMSHDLQLARFAMRHPKMLDTLCYTEHRSKMVDFIQAKAQNAVGFTFDPEISRTAATFTAEHPDVMAALAHDVRLPFPAMIIASCNLSMVSDQVIHDDAITTRLDLVWSNVTNTRISSIPLGIMEPDTNFPKTSLLIIPQVYEFDIEPRVDILPPLNSKTELYFKDMLPADFLEGRDKPTFFKSLEHVAYIMHLLGSATKEEDIILINNLGEHTRGIGVIDLLKHMSMRQPFWPADYESASKHGVLQRCILEHAGHPRALYGLLALLNLRDRVSHVSHGVRKPGLFRHKAHSAPHIVEHAVTILLPEAKAMKLLKREAKLATGRRHKRHSVRGHWYNRIRDRECKHVYEQLEPDHYQCAKCESKRTWKQAHERGDASLGWVRHTQYNVEQR